MSGQTYLSIKAIHLFGFLLWIGGITALCMALRVRAAAGEAARAAFASLEGAFARAMELGALVTIACGVAMIVSSPAPVSPMKQPYLHIKLTLVVVIIGLHGLVRAKMARMNRGKGGPPPAFVPVLLLGLALAIFILAVVKPMYRM